MAYYSLGKIGHKAGTSEKTGEAFSFWAGYIKGRTLRDAILDAEEKGDVKIEENSNGRKKTIVRMTIEKRSKESMEMFKEHLKKYPNTHTVGYGSGYEEGDAEKELNAMDF